MSIQFQVVYVGIFPSPFWYKKTGKWCVSTNRLSSSSSEAQVQSPKSPWKPYKLFDYIPLNSVCDLFWLLFQMIIISALFVSALAASLDKPPAAILKSSSDQKVDGSFTYKYLTTCWICHRFTYTLHSFSRVLLIT